MGRSSLIIREVKGTYEDNACKNIIGVDFSVKEYEVGDQRIKVRLWDTYTIGERSRRYHKLHFRSKKVLNQIARLSSSVST